MGDLSVNEPMRKQSVASIGGSINGDLERRQSMQAVSLSMRAMQITRRLSVVSKKSSKEGAPTAPSIKYENTYRMEPDDEMKFKVKPVEDIIKNVLKTHLCEVDYKQIYLTDLPSELAALIKERVKDLKMARYKVVCHVVLGEAGSNTVRTASRCIWNCSTDNYASATYENKTLYAQGTVYGIYFD